MHEVWRSLTQIDTEIFWQLFSKRTAILKINNTKCFVENQVGKNIRFKKRSFILFLKKVQFCGLLFSHPIPWNNYGFHPLLSWILEQLYRYSVAVNLRPLFIIRWLLAAFGMIYCWYQKLPNYKYIYFKCYSYNVLTIGSVVYHLHIHIIYILYYKADTKTHEHW